MDRCPHRMATLSDGFIDKKRNEVCTGQPHCIAQLLESHCDQQQQCITGFCLCTHIVVSASRMACMWCTHTSRPASSPVSTVYHSSLPILWLLPTLPSPQVVCAYHGFRFRSDGSCSSIPQALDPKAEQTACASQRSCATAFPTREAGGLLWVWPDASSNAAAEAQGEK